MLLRMYARTMQWVAVASILLIPFLFTEQVIIAMKLTKQVEWVRWIGLVTGPAHMMFLLLKPLMPTVQSQWGPISLLPSIEGILCLCLAYFSNAVALYLLGMDNKLTARHDTARMKQEYRTVVLSRKKQEQHYRESLVYCFVLEYPFEQFPQYTQKLFGKLRTIWRSDNVWIVPVYSCAEALELSCRLREETYYLYNSLRPIDPQPPFKMLLVAYETAQPSPSQVAQEAHEILLYCEEFRIIASDMVYNGHQAHLKETPTTYSRYGVETLGEFEFEGGLKRQLFRVVAKAGFIG
jgi:hypothetical protein